MHWIALVLEYLSDWAFFSVYIYLKWKRHKGNQNKAFQYFTHQLLAPKRALHTIYRMQSITEMQLMMHKLNKRWNQKSVRIAKKSTHTKCAERSNVCYRNDQNRTKIKWFQREIWDSTEKTHKTRKKKHVYIYKEDNQPPTVWIRALFYRQTPKSSLNKNKKRNQLLFLHPISSSTSNIGAFFFYIRLSICFHFVPFESVPWLWKWWLWLAWRSGKKNLRREGKKMEKK